ncbi:NADP-dependent oxidoreductase [Saccharothrix hoggarensis]|uniref:NADP-dependent oxidoreductase n=1 Tax=Saccharothrix hoggarensis TaxID=913853 RepID=A0ABW3QNJ5_9PSEU
MAPTTTREIRLAARPVGEPTPDHFTLATADLPELADGQVLVRNTWMSVDPYMRGRMDEGESYIPPFRLGEAMDGGAVGEVIASRADAVPVGSTVVHFLGWREHAVVDAAAATVVDTALAPAQAYLGVLGTPGLTAYVSLTETAPVRPGDVVFVSAAAGAVGSVAGQLARLLGASRVIGSVGGPVKAKKVVADFGFDVALDYKDGPLADRLASAAPAGVDVYLDHVGGDHLEAAIGAMRDGGRIALVGAVSQYNATGPVPGPNLYPAAVKQLSLRGMVVSSYLHRFPEYVERAAGWLADGSLRAEETVVDGLERAPEAFLGVLRGANTGKMLVRLDAR